MLLLRTLTSDQLWLVVAAMVVFASLVSLAYVRPAVMATLALGLFAYESIFGPPAGFNIAGILIYPRDGLYMAMAVAAAIRFLGPAKTSSWLSWEWWGLLLIALASFAKGIRTHGANSAGNDFRQFFYLVSAVTFFATHRAERRWVRSTVDVWIGIGLLLAFAGFARMFGFEIGAATTHDALEGGRALYAAPTLLIAQAALMAFFSEQLGSRWQHRRWVPYVLLFGVLAFRHRTVWLVMVVSLVAMWTALRPEMARNEVRDAVRLGRSLAVVAAGLSVVVLLVAGGSVSTFRSELGQSAATASGPRSTSTWRIEGWKALLREQSAKESDLVLGIPYGSGYTRKVAGATVKVSPHSWYIQTINRVGLVGLALILLVLGSLFRRGRPAGLLPRNLGALLVLSLVIFGLAYQPPETQGVLLGLVSVAACVGVDRSESEDAGARPQVKPVAAPI